MNTTHNLPKTSQLYHYIGQTYGWLKIINVFRDEKRYVKCICKCIRCGKETEIYLTNLKSGATKSCGCLEKENRYHYKDITGQIFADLRVEEKTDLRKDGSVVWKCVCMKCGNVSFRTGNDLKKGYGIRCRCSSQRKTSNTFKDLTNHRFNLLTAQHPTKKRNAKGSVMWRCKCDCGNEVDISEDALVHGRRKSCGCMRIKAGEQLSKNKKLIDGTCIESLERKRRSDNQTGYTGVYQRKNGKYRVTIGFKKKQYYLGDYSDLIKARDVYQEAHILVHLGFKKAYKKWKDKSKNNPLWEKQNPLIFEVQQSSDGTLKIIQSKEDT